MAGNNISIANVVSVSVIPPQPGLGNYNTSNLALFTEEPYANTFGNLGYKIYLDPGDIETDFGTDSKTFLMAAEVFAQQPNIQANGGYLVIIPFITAVQHITLSAIAASGTFVLNFGGHASAAINWNDNAAAIQTKLQAVLGLSDATVTGSISSELLTISFVGVYGPAALLTVTSNTLQTAGSSAITATVTTTTVGEDLVTALTRANGLVQFFGAMGTLIFPQVDMLAAATYIETQLKLLFVVSITAADVAPGGMLDLLRTGGLTQTRGLYYGDVLDTALGFMAAYAGRGLSTVYSGSLTAQTMDLKTLSGIQPDPSLNQTLLTQCETAGADVYASIQGVSKVISSGGNDFFDNQDNLLWFLGALQVAEFNALATVGTKIPQTEDGMTILKGAARAVCEQAVANGFLAPGAWTGGATFGNQVDFLSNIAQRGYYIYSVPVSQQSPADRVARKAPLIQIAIKYAGAIQSVSLVINVNQ